MQRILKTQWLLAGLIVAAPFMGCAGEQSSGEPLDRVTQATMASGFTSTPIALAHFGALNTHVHSSADGTSPVPADWQAMIKTKGLTDLHIRSNRWDPGGSTGWHTHPGPSLITVTGGTLTVYDESCTPHVFSATGSNAFVDVGGGEVHLVRNEGAGVATAVVVQFVPAGAERRIDKPAPSSNCPL